MIHLARPPDRVLREWLARAADEPPAAGLSALLDAPTPSGFDRDRHRAAIGAGEADFDRARDALFAWAHFRLGWCELLWPAVEPAPGATVGVLARAAGAWWSNACRVVDRVESEDAGGRVAAFSYVTLSDHAEEGAERFAVAWSRAAGVVAFELEAVSRPRHPLARLGRPIVRKLQARFRSDATEALRRALSAAPPRAPRAARGC